MAAVEENEGEFVGAIVEGCFKSTAPAGPDVVDGDDFAARGLDLVGQQFGDLLLGGFVLIRSREIGEQVGERQNTE